MQGVLIIYIWFSTLPQEGLKKTRELGGRESVEKKMNDTQGVDRSGGEVSGKEKAGRAEEATGGSGTRRDDVKRKVRTESVEYSIEKKKKKKQAFLLCSSLCFLVLDFTNK